jgi:hypothetical protein
MYVKGGGSIGGTRDLEVQSGVKDVWVAADVVIDTSRSERVGRDVRLAASGQAGIVAID